MAAFVGNLADRAKAMRGSTAKAVLTCSTHLSEVILVLRKDEVSLYCNKSRVTSMQSSVCQRLSFRRRVLQFCYIYIALVFLEIPILDGMYSLTCYLVNQQCETINYKKKKERPKIREEKVLGV